MGVAPKAAAAAPAAGVSSQRDRFFSKPGVAPNPRSCQQEGTRRKEQAGRNKRSQKQLETQSQQCLQQQKNKALSKESLHIH
jgi:hypothetical protein